MHVEYRRATKDLRFCGGSAPASFSRMCFPAMSREIGFGVDLSPYKCSEPSQISQSCLLHGTWKIRAQDACYARRFSAVSVRSSPTPPFDPPRGSSKQLPPVSCLTRQRVASFPRHKAVASCFAAVDLFSTARGQVRVKRVRFPRAQSGRRPGRRQR